MAILTLGDLKQRIEDRWTAIRRVRTLYPAGGDGDKVFPPTYQGSVYATEDRVMRNERGELVKIPTVLLDSVQSQANRMELALLQGYREGRLQFPLLEVDFSTDDAAGGTADIGRLTSLEVPHRAADAVLRDSLFDGTPYRQSEIGRALESSSVLNATPLLGTCPTALIFGMWDSTASRGTSGLKLQRALVSEIVGFDCAAGVRPTSRIDPLQIEKVEVFKMAEWPGYSVDEDRALKDNAGRPVATTPAEMNHGNITPSLEDREGKRNHGGVTLREARQTLVLSLACLRRLQFPVDGQRSPELDLAGQAVLTAMALAAVCWQDDMGFDLRSRCLLDGPRPPFQWLKHGEVEEFALDKDSASALLSEATSEAVGLGLPWETTPRTLIPSPELRGLVRRSRGRRNAE